MVYALNREGQISNVLTGNKCASGTGEFFLQQLRRMDVSLKEASQWAVSEAPYHVSGRCSVFCKSDCTHATNKGIPKAQVTAGLCQMMAHKILELLKKVERRNVMLTGGAALNAMMVSYLQKEIEGLIVPPQAPYFEALGAALWALENETSPFPGTHKLFKTEVDSFDTLPPLANFEALVDFKQMDTGTIQAGDVCLLGLDVGSTTTKAVLVRQSDTALLASDYRRTSGDPVGASRQCYRAILRQIEQQVDPADIHIIGLGVCGSGRKIAGLHALTDGVINEIIAHATAAIYFDPGVDTIFEIGGQDAKYTYVTNAVPSDYAMNEACSAGTGSFLEESALETLGVPMEKIAEVALTGQKPPNFNDQCAAFIASDIKNAIHEGVEHADIIAGLVYSICMNYSNRVKGNRPVGEKVFMQGGVCYNKAIPLAMAALVGKPIIVPPEPGLMGAFGVALAVQNRIELGLMQPQSFDLKHLVAREVTYRKPFVCKGGKERCDRHCEIAVIEIDGRKYPFGGACNRYDNLRRKLSYDVAGLDLVRVRQRLIFEKYGFSPSDRPLSGRRGRIGLNRSFLVNTYYPLYSNFFAALGFEPVIPDVPSKQGIDQRNAAFCYPAELAHGFFHALLEIDPVPEFIFLPHFKSIPLHDGTNSSQVCPLVQGEPFYLTATFAHQLTTLKERGVTVLTPLIDFSLGMESAAQPLVETARQMGIDRKAAENAFRIALEKQKACLAEMHAIGARTLSELEQDPDRMAVVLFARPYNGFVEEAHMGIPHKLASRGVLVMPLDFLPMDNRSAKRHMYWGMGQVILNIARMVKRHPQLFGTYITNFSCGPDSFILGYFREIMGRKPSLTLELDSHTADAGLETRIEAFLDIIAAYRQLLAQHRIPSPDRKFSPAQMLLDGKVAKIVTSSGETLPLTDPRVTVLLPSMGQYLTESFAAVLRSMGFNTYPHPPSDEAVLKLGRANTSCKECLPLILTTGTLLDYVHNGRRPGDVTVYFMATGSGPCRFGQYYIFMEDLIKKFEIPDVALLSLTSENSYQGMGRAFEQRGWWAIIVSDVMEDIRSMLLTNAADVQHAMQTFQDEWHAILSVLERGSFALLEKQVAETARKLAGLELKRSPAHVPTISLTGEIFVRRDGLSRQYLTEYLAQKGFATICTPVAEWVHYSDFLVDEGLVAYKMALLEKLQFFLRKKFMSHYEKRLKTIFAQAGLIHIEPIDIEKIVSNAQPHISHKLTGEAVLTIGGSLTDVASHVCGVIAIGPFGCMPNRLSEAILNENMNREGKLATDPHNTLLKATLSDVQDLPFLAIESDGSAFPQLINAKLESFCLRAERLHVRMLSARNVELEPPSGQCLKE
jgi:predicted CoA-substrate-specific enzyme activase